MHDLYIYYQVRRQDADALRALLTALHARLAHSHGVAAQLKRRPQERDGLQTWMEIYPAAPAGFEDTLEAALRDAGAPALIAGARHTEVFMDVTACA